MLQVLLLKVDEGSVSLLTHRRLTVCFVMALVAVYLADVSELPLSSSLVVILLRVVLTEV